MTYYAFKREPYKLVVAMEQPQPPTEELVEKTVREVIRTTLYLDQDPYEQARWSDLHNQEMSRPRPTDEEEMESEEYKEALLQWIMTTDELQEALRWFRFTDPTDVQDENVRVFDLYEEEVWELNVETYLLNLTVTEHD